MPGLHPPGFWQAGTGRLLPALLAPASALVTLSTARRLSQPGWRAPVPVICCGNAGVGGAGKTTLALDLAARLSARRLAVHLLTRGYGGTARGPRQVHADTDEAAVVGDEALLLAECAPTWLGADRAASARAAVAAGATALVMDDGLQNPTLEKTLSVLVIDGVAGFGNGHVLPAGPLREPVRAAAARCGAAVLVGSDATGAVACLPPHLPVLAATLQPEAGITALAGRPVVAFAGIGRPEKFFTMLEEAGLVLLRRLPYPDHYRFPDAELARLLAMAADLNAAAVTTPKDFVRIPRPLRGGFTPVGVRLAWRDEDAVDAILDEILGARPAA